MIKRKKMSTIIIISLLFVHVLCIGMMYIFANNTMSKLMKDSEMENLHKNFNVQTNIIEEYIAHQEDLLIKFGNSTEVIEFLKEPQNKEKGEKA